MVTEKRASILCILLVLLDNTDENHKLTQMQIAAKVEDRFGLKIERKSISSAVDTINSCFDDGLIEIEKTGKGIYVKERLFDMTELTYLADSVFSDSSLSNPVSAGFIEKLSRLSNDPDGLLKARCNQSRDFARTLGYDSYTNYNTINQALKNNNQITFNYLHHYDENDKEVLTQDPKTNAPKIFNFSPYYLVMGKNGKHYVLGSRYYDDPGKWTAYKVDLIRNLKEKSKYKRKPKNTAIVNPTSFSLAKFLEENPKMFVGEKPVDCEVKILKEKGTLYLHDEFGFNMKIIKKNNEVFAKFQTTPSSLKLFGIDYCNFVEIISPIEVRQAIYEQAKFMARVYDIKKV